MWHGAKSANGGGVRRRAGPAARMTKTKTAAAAVAAAAAAAVVVVVVVVLVEGMQAETLTVMEAGQRPAAVVEAETANGKCHDPRCRHVGSS